MSTIELTALIINFRRSNKKISAIKKNKVDVDKNERKKKNKRKSN